MAELQKRRVLVVEIPASASEMVLTLELNLERDKTGDVSKFHDTYIIHISKFRDHTRSHAINFQSIFALKTVSRAPNEYIVQNHLNIALFNVF